MVSRRLYHTQTSHRTVGFQLFYLEAFMSQRYCCGAICFASVADRGHWYVPRNLETSQDFSGLYYLMPVHPPLGLTYELTLKLIFFYKIVAIPFCHNMPVVKTLTHDCAARFSI